MELCLCLVEAATWGMGAAGALMDLIQCDSGTGQTGTVPGHRVTAVHVCACVCARSALGMEKCSLSVGHQIRGEEHFGKRHMK